MKDFLKKTIREAGNTIQSSSKDVIFQKGGVGNYALQADLDSEKYIMGAISKAYPSHNILSEETESAIKNPEKVDSLWIIDPLDGTANFKNDIPCYTVSIAYVQKGEVQMGAVFDPNRNELFFAQKNKGAFCNDIKIRVSDGIDLRNLIVNVGSPYNEDNFKLTYPLGETFHKNGMRTINLGSAALECAWVASGKIGAYYEAGLKVWDFAAGQLLMTEAGGMMIDPFNADNFSLFDQKAVLAGNKEIVFKLKNLITNQVS